MLNTLTAELVRIALRYVAAFLATMGWTESAAIVGGSELATMVAGLVLALITEAMFFINKRIQARKDAEG